MRILLWLLALVSCRPSPGRFLSELPSNLGVFNREDLSSGYVTIYVVGVLYLAGVIYILYSRFVNAIIEDLVYMIDVL